MLKEFKRYICFAGWDYETQGGLGDADDTFDTLEEALKWKYNQFHTDEYYPGQYDWAYIFDCNERKIVRENK